MYQTMGTWSSIEFSFFLYPKRVGTNGETYSYCTCSCAGVRTQWSTHDTDRLIILTIQEETKLRYVQGKCYYKLSKRIVPLKPFVAQKHVDTHKNMPGLYKSCMYTPSNSWYPTHRIAFKTVVNDHGDISTCLQGIW